MNRQVDKIVFLYKNRLLGFGYELIEYIARINDCKIEIIDNTQKNKEQELVEDLVQIITVFSCRLQGKFVGCNDRFQGNMKIIKKERSMSKPATL